jgi:phosphatidylserine/phosphatidylglycerophosphate/cardiolipin synthase-like enzyme
VRCHGTTGGTGNGAHRTVLRLSVAGWFDTYGQKIANRVRQLWDQGCDIKILTTLAGRGINQTLKDPRGRGPVPIKKLTVDRNNDGIPEKYTHMKAMSISGVYDGDSSASVVFTGSPNWSSRAARSEEIWVRVLDVPGMVSKYQRWINRWYGSRVAHAKLMTRADLKAAVARKVAGEGLTAKGTQRAYDDLLSGFELD